MLSDFCGLNKNEIKGLQHEIPVRQFERAQVKLK